MAEPKMTQQLAARRRLEAANDVFRQVIRECALRFREYEDHHQGRAVEIVAALGGVHEPTPAIIEQHEAKRADAQAKADRNAEMALRCESVLPQEMLGPDGRALPL